MLRSPGTSGSTADGLMTLPMQVAAQFLPEGFACLNTEWGWAAIEPNWSASESVAVLKQRQEIRFTSDMSRHYAGKLELFYRRRAQTDGPP